MINGRVGCEIEGIVKIDKENELKNLCHTNHWVYAYDGSIRGNRCGENIFEFKAGIYKINEKQKLVDELKKAFSIIRVNNTCGLHIHLSFDCIPEYYKLYSWQFVNVFQNVIKSKLKTQSEKRRFTNHFCKFYINEADFKNATEKQLQSFGKGGDRYYAVNFNSCNVYNTIEFRIFPATKNIKKFEYYLNLLLKTIESYISEVKLEPIKLSIIHRPKIKEETKPWIYKEIITKKEKEMPK